MSDKSKLWGVVYAAIPYNVEDVVLPDFVREEIADRIVEDIQPSNDLMYTNGEILQWLYQNTPLAIKPKSKHAKAYLVCPFTSHHAFEAVCRHLAKQIKVMQPKTIDR